MNQTERRTYLITHLLAEHPEYRDVELPLDVREQRQLLRGLMNIRAPHTIDEDFLAVQDAYLREAIVEKGIVRIEELSFNRDGLAIWQGDITRLASDAIVNAANSGMTGCYVPNHACIDNAILI